MKKCFSALVTGGAGFIGSNLVRLLLNRGCSVRVLDNFSSGYEKNIDGLDIDLVEGDILDESALLRAMEGVDVVFHMAASVGRQRSIDHVKEDSMVNLMGTVNVLEAMRKRGVERIISSSCRLMVPSSRTSST